MFQYSDLCCPEEEFSAGAAEFIQTVMRKDSVLSEEESRTGMASAIGVSNPCYQLANQESA
jgi:hypothetical protein